MRNTTAVYAAAVAASLAVIFLLGCHSGGGPTAPGIALLGSWGGDGGVVELTEQGGTLAFNCAASEIDEPVRPWPTGEFAVGGWYEFRAGPAPYRREAARFQGVVRGNELELTVTIVATGRTVEKLV